MLQVINLSTMARAVVADLLAIGHSNAKIVTSSYVPTSSEVLIAMRVGLVPNSSKYDFHFMKYNQSNGYWYHKPGSTAVLKYKGDPKSSVWIYEDYIDGSWRVISSFTYNSAIKYIVYSIN